MVRRFSHQEWNIYKDLRLSALTDSPDAFGRTLAEELDRSDTEWSNRLSSCSESNWDLPLVAEVDNKPIGLVWGRIEINNHAVANLYQMWVASSHRRIGIGQMLLEKVIAWARAKDATYLDLSVTFGDSPAMRLYTRTGFMPVGEPQLFRQDSELLGQAMRLKLKRSAS